MIFFTLFFKYINLVNKIVIPQKSVIAKPQDFWSNSSGNALVRSLPKKQDCHTIFSTTVLFSTLLYYSLSFFFLLAKIPIIPASAAAKTVVQSVTSDVSPVFDDITF